MIKRIIRLIINMIPVRNIILFESRPDFSDNTRAVFDEMIKRGVNQKYKMVWFCYDNKKDDRLIGLKNVKLVDVDKHYYFKDIIRAVAKVSICCNRFLGSIRNNQKSFYLMHGSPIKDTSSYYICNSNIDYMITASSYMNDKSARAMKFPVDKCFPLGYPRNDFLKNPNVELSTLFGKYDKYIAWYPTVKQMENVFDYGIEPIPFFDNKSSVDKLNEYCFLKNILLIIKPHFAQIKNYNEKSFSNIVFVKNTFFDEKGIFPYEFLSSCDALLTDYSSVLYDYMLCNKPIGLIWNDLTEFSNSVGLVDFYKESTDGCVIINDFQELLDFIKNISENDDKLAVRREKTNNLVNIPREMSAILNVTDFIIENGNIK